MTFENSLFSNKRVCSPVARLTRSKSKYIGSRSLTERIASSGCFGDSAAMPAREPFGVSAFSSPRREVHDEHLKVLVAADVLPVQHVVAGEREAVAADAAQAVVGDRLGRVRIVARRDVDVQHAVARGDVAEPAAVGAHLAVGAFGVTEQELAGEQGRRRSLGRGRGLGRGLRLWVRGRRGRRRSAARPARTEATTRSSVDIGASPVFVDVAAVCWQPKTLEQ